MLREDPTMTAEELEAERAEQQSIADNGQFYLLMRFLNTMFTNHFVFLFFDFTAEPLTEEEIAEKDSLTGQGFPDWNKRDYQGFIRGSEAYGRLVHLLSWLTFPYCSFY